MRNFFSSRTIAGLAAVGLAAFALVGCSSGNSADAKIIELTVGASPTPHAEILEFIQKNLAEKNGIKLSIKTFDDYKTPNSALDEGSIDANYFQTVPYLKEQEIQNPNYKFTAGKGIHLEPLAIYGGKTKALKDFPDGGTIGIISDVTNQERALKLLATEGFVELPESGPITVSTVKKLKNLDFKEIDGPQLASTLNDVDLAVINGNYAVLGNLSPKNDGLAIEPTEGNDAANLLVWKSDIAGQKKAGVETLEKLLHSPEVKKFIEDKWPNGAVIPVF